MGESRRNYSEKRVDLVGDSECGPRTGRRRNERMSNFDRFVKSCIAEGCCKNEQALASRLGLASLKDVKNGRRGIDPCQTRKSLEKHPDILRLFNKYWDDRVRTKESPPEPEKTTASNQAKSAAKQTLKDTKPIDICSVEPRDYLPVTPQDRSQWPLFIQSELSKVVTTPNQNGFRNLKALIKHVGSNTEYELDALLFRRKELAKELEKAKLSLPSSSDENDRDRYLEQMEKLPPSIVCYDDRIRLTRQRLNELHELDALADQHYAAYNNQRQQNLLGTLDV